MLADDDPDRKLYLGNINSQKMVMDRLHAPEKAKEARDKIDKLIENGALTGLIGQKQAGLRLLQGRPGESDVPAEKR